MEYWHGCPWSDLLWCRQQSVCLQAAGRNAHAYTYCDSYRNTYFYCNGDCNSDRNSHCNIKSKFNTDCNCQSHSHYDSASDSYPDANGQADAHCQTSRNAKGAAHAPAAPSRAVRELRVSRHFLKPSDATAWVSAHLKLRVDG